LLGWLLASATDDDDDALALLFAGMERMTTQEYYDAINRRLHEVREQRKSEPGFDREATASYIRSLSGGGSSNGARKQQQQ
jgi:hypothetical protein